MASARSRPCPAIGRSIHARSTPADIAYHFEGDYATELLDDPVLLGRLNAAVAAWRTIARGTPPPVLELFDRDGVAVVLDTRPVALRPMTPLTPGQRDLLIALDRPRTRDAIAPDQSANADWLVSRGFVIHYEDRLVGIVVRPAQCAVAQPVRRAAGAFA